MHRTCSLLTGLFLALIVSACGGGGGGPAPAEARLPVADAGPDQSVHEHTTVHLDGAGSDMGGVAGSYTWQQAAGPRVTIEDGDQAQASFVAPTVPLDGVVELEFRLVIVNARAEASESRVFVYVQSADYIVYIAQGSSPEGGATGAQELHMWHEPTWQVTKLSGVLPAGTDVVGFEIAPDRSHVAFVTQGPHEGGAVVRKLWVTPLATMTPVLLTPVEGDGPSTTLAPPNPAGNGLRGELRGSVAWAPDGRHIAWYSDTLVDEAYDLHWQAIGVAGPEGAPTRLTDHASAGGGQTPGGMHWSPDADALAFTAEDERVGIRRLYVAKTDGAPRVRVSGNMRETSRIDPVRWSPDGQWLAYVADQEVEDVFELHAVRPDGSGARILSGARTRDGDVVPRLLWSPDGTRIAILADTETDEVDELYAVEVDTASRVKLSPPIPTGGQIDELVGWAPDGHAFAFVAEAGDPGVHELWVALADGSNRQVVSGPMTTGGDVADTELCERRVVWSPDSTRIAYVADQDTDGTYEVYGVLVYAFGTSPISGPAEVGTRACDPLFVGEGAAGVVFLGDTLSPGTRQLYVTSSVGMFGPFQLNRDLVAGGGVRDFAVSPDGRRVAYKAEQHLAGVDDLYIVDLEAPGESQHVSTWHAAGAGVLAWAWSRSAP